MDTSTKKIAGNSLGIGRNGRQTLSGKGSRGSNHRGHQKLISRYSMIIQWSEEDDVFIVTLPEFGGCKTHGTTYEKAAKAGREVLELLIASHEEEGEPLPKPNCFESV